MDKISDDLIDLGQEKSPYLIFLRGSATVGHTLIAGIFDKDSFTLAGAVVNYQWQQSAKGNWIDIVGETARSLKLTDFLLEQQVRMLASCVDSLGSSKVVASSGVTVAAQNAIVLENQKPGTTAWRILSTSQATTEILGYADVTSINKGQAINFKVSLEQAGQYQIDVYRLGYYAGTGGRLVASVAGLKGVTQANSTLVNPSTKLVECKWNTSYTLQTGSDWTSGLYFAKLTNSGTGKQNYIQFVVRDDNRPADIGFQDAIATAQAYNNYGGYSTYDFNSAGKVRPTSTTTTNIQALNRSWQALLKIYLRFILTRLVCTVRNKNLIPAKWTRLSSIIARLEHGHTDVDGQRAYQVSFDRPFQYNTPAFPAQRYNNPLTWEYNMIRWLESQGYDVSYYTNLDVSINPLQLHSQKTFLSVGHDEYWSREQRNNVEQARDNGINLAFFSANTACWQVRFDPSSSGQANRVMTVYRDDSYPAIGTGASIDPIAQTNPAAATTLFRSSEVNRPENALLGVGYIGDWSGYNVYNGFDYVVSNAADPYYAHTGLQNGDKLKGLVGYEWDAVLNNGFTPAGLVVLSQSPVQLQGPLPPLPPGTNTTISNAVRYTAASGAKIFSTGSIQWVWGLDSDGVTDPREDICAKQITVNVFADMGAKPQTPDAGIVV
ncbi:MAG: hypothetical protein KME35_18300 [Aphanocapsa sp. GSE-SYN-MK-11-07L]|jgi:hypothetical protein|nr:hypothetical protein [Aphanocapsa sp. GSE-SYN-MK-11-07L]